MSERNRPVLLRFGSKEQIVLAKRLAMLLRAGVPLSRALSMLGEGNRTKSAAHIYGHIMQDIARGRALSDALGRFRNIFGELAIDIIAVGERTGTLSQNLDHLADELRKKDALRKKVIGALVYPAIIVLATAAITLVLTVYIFPKITPVFQSFGKRLPLSTRILIALSQFLLHRGIEFFFVLAIIIAAMTFSVKKTRARIYTDRLLLRTPIFGRLARAYHAGSAARSLSLLLSADMRIVQALEITSRSSHNSAYRGMLDDIAAEVARGQKLSAQLRRYPRLIAPLSAQMVDAGEEAGNLPGSLMYVTELYEEEINELTKNLTTMLEPILMMTMGLIVGFIAVSIITPIYGITQTLTPQ